MGLFEDLDKFVGQIGDLAKKSVGIYGDIIGATEDAKEQRPVIQPVTQPAPPPPQYPQNVSANYVLLGAALLVVLWIVRK